MGFASLCVVPSCYVPVRQGNSTGICFLVHGHVSRISADHCYASRCSCHQLIERMRCFRISARLPPAMATCMLHHLLHVSHCAKFLTLLTGFPHRQEFVASEHAYCTWCSLQFCSGLANIIDTTGWSWGRGYSVELARYAYSFVRLFEMLTVKLLRLKLITMCL